MHRTKITNSSNICEVAYDPQAEALEVRFVTSSKKLYRYSKVNSETYIGLLTAKSVGSYFSENIRSHPNRYPFTVVSEEPEASGFTIQESFRIAADLRLAVEALDTAIQIAKARGAIVTSLEKVAKELKGV